MDGPPRETREKKGNRCADDGQNMVSVLMSGKKNQEDRKTAVS